MKKRLRFGKNLFLKTVFSILIKRTIFGKWGTPDLVVLAVKFM